MNVKAAWQAPASALYTGWGSAAAGGLAVPASGGSLQVQAWINKHIRVKRKSTNDNNTTTTTTTTTKNSNTNKLIIVLMM